MGTANLLRKNLKYALNQSNPEAMVFWLAGVNTLITVIVVGIFNTTLHHEHGLLAMILIALSCSYFDKSNDKTKSQT